MKQKEVEKVPANTSLQPEEVIIRLAKQGRLAAAGQMALQSSLQQGLTVTVLENDTIYHIYPDGTRKKIKQVNAPANKYSTGKLQIL